MGALVYLADLTHTGTITNADTFPLGVGSIAAYAKHHLGDTIDVEIFKFPADLEAALADRTPAVIGFSNYIWSHNLTMAFARDVKARHPETVVVMGGPNICITADGRRRFLEANPAVDFYVKWEGEAVFTELLQRLAEADYDAGRIKRRRSPIANLLYLDGDAYVEGPDQRVRDLSILPSPYLTGLFDKFFEQGLRPLVETTRGCPYACTFCTDSHSHRSKVFRRSPEYFRDELEYIASRMTRAADLMIADLNFGMYQEDLVTARQIRDVIDRYGWPRTITGAPGKSHPERVLETVKIINGDRGVLKFAASMQSTDPAVLAAIARKNLPLDRLVPMVQTATADPDDKTEYFTELILGLPGESKESHIASLRDCVDRLGMNIVNVHQLTLLQGAPMALPEQRERHRLDVRHRVMVGCIGSYRIGGVETPVAEFEEVVVGTATMSFEEWLDCRVLNLLVKLYIDRDYFVEIFGLVQRLGLSRLDLLRRLQQRHIDRHRGFARLVDFFRRKTVEPLHPTRDAVAAFTARPDVVARFAAGELGGNELLVSRAKAYLECNDEIHAALRDATLDYLADAGYGDAEYARYVDEAVRFSKLRKFHPATYEVDALYDSFSFDFVAAAKANFRVTPAEVRRGGGQIRFYFNDISQSEIAYALKQWVAPVRPAAVGRRPTQAQADYNFGKLFHMSNLKVLSRSAEFVG